MAKTAKNGLESETASKTTATEAGTSVTDPIRLRLQALLADRTGLTGDYDLHMEFAPEAPAPKPGEAVASEPTSPSFMKAPQEQLGLKLETTKGPVEFLVIDRIERPSAN